MILIGYLFKTFIFSTLFALKLVLSLQFGFSSDFKERFLKTLISLFFILCTCSTVWAQQNPPSEINTFVVDIDPATKTRLVFTVHSSELTVAARNLAQLLEQLPNSSQINLILGTQERQNEITHRMSRDLSRAAERGVSINIMPFDVNLAEQSIRENAPLPVADLALEEKGTKDDVHRENERNTVITTRQTLSQFAQSARNVQWKGLITATLITGAGANVLGPSWVFAADVPVSYQLTSFFASAVMLYWIPRKTQAIQNFYQLSYEYVRTAAFAVPTIINRDFKVPAPTSRGQAITTGVVGGFLVSYSIQSLLNGLTLGFDVFTYSDFQNILLRNSLMIGAASTPWSVLTHKLRTQSPLSEAWVTGARTLNILGIGLISMSLPGLTETYLRGFSLNWAEYVLLATGATGILANKFAVPFLNKAEHSIWLQYMNRNLDYVVNLPENVIRLMSGRHAQNTYWSVKRLRKEASQALCTRFLSGGG